MGLREIILGSSLLLPTFLCTGDSGRPVQNQAAIPVWNDPNNLDQRVLTQAKRLYSQAYTLYKTGEEKRADKRFGEARTAAEMGVIFLNDAEKLLLEEEKKVKAPSIDLFLAQIYWLRDLPSSTSLDRESDHGLAVPRWENFLKAVSHVDPNNGLVKECRTKLFKCRYESATYKINKAQLLWALANQPEKIDEIKETSPVKTAEEAFALAERFYREALPHLQVLIKEQPHNPELLKMASTCYFRLGKFDDSLIYLRQLIRVQPNEITAYHAVAMVYLEKKTIWRIFDELNQINHPDAKRHFAGAAADALDEISEKTGMRAFFAFDDNEEAESIAEFFYETCKVRYAFEKKNDKPDFTYALTDLFFASFAEYGIGVKNKDDNRCRQALQRVISNYNSMNLQPSILDEFKRIVIDEKRIIERQFTNKFYEGLKELRGE